jgi:hypothetical protein
MSDQIDFTPDDVLGFEFGSGETSSVLSGFTIGTGIRRRPL